MINKPCVTSGLLSHALHWIVPSVFSFFNIKSLTKGHENSYTISCHHKTLLCSPVVTASEGAELGLRLARLERDPSPIAYLSGESECSRPETSEFRTKRGLMDTAVQTRGPQEGQLLPGPHPPASELALESDHLVPPPRTLPCPLPLHPGSHDGTA